jgi:hypothetical protein
MTRADQIEMVAECMAAIFEAIELAGDRGMPVGPLYAVAMSIMSLEAFTALIDMLKDTGRVRESGHVLYVMKAS